jgi:hypothetical protein
LNEVGKEFSLFLKTKRITKADDLDNDNDNSD